MGGLCSCLGGDESEEGVVSGVRAEAKPLLDGPVPAPYQQQQSHQHQPPRPPAEMRPVVLPKFSARRAAPSLDAPPLPSKVATGIFCRCGGPGSLVKLLPCGCSSLCLNCAQQERACPDCNRAISDSLPSWRVASSREE